MEAETPKFISYGNEFNSFDELNTAIENRKLELTKEIEGDINLYGYAIVSEKDETGMIVRVPVVISHKGNIIDDDHNEYL
jgi:hypothetical protein